MTVYLIAGFGEDQTIFSRIKDRIEGKQVFLSLWDVVGNERKKDIDISSVASGLIARYSISQSDLLIGHSTGAWLALHVKNQIGCRIIQIAGWTDHAKVKRPISNRYLIYFAVKAGLVYNPLVAKLVARRFTGRPSRDIFIEGYDRLVHGNRSNVLNQLSLIFNPYSKAIKVSPDLAIHARGDDIITFPDGEFYEVDGDHFSLHTHPEQVIEAIADFIKYRPCN